METTEAPTVAKNQSVEKGIYLDHYCKRVHACKVREDIGAGITRCGVRFLIGDKQWRSDAVWGAPAREDSDGTWTKCPKCEEAANYDGIKKRWQIWKQMIGRTLRMTGLMPPQEQGK